MRRWHGLSIICVQKVPLRNVIDINILRYGLSVNAFELPCALASKRPGLLAGRLVGPESRHGALQRPTDSNRGDPDSKASGIIGLDRDATHCRLPGRCYEATPRNSSREAPQRLFFLH